jgi:hypothetical protein
MNPWFGRRAVYRERSGDLLLIGGRSVCRPSWQADGSPWRALVVGGARDLEQLTAALDM